MAPTQSRPRDAVKENWLTQDLLDRACAGALGAACEAKWILVDEAVRAGRLRAYQAPGAKFLIAKRAARRSGRGKYKDIRAKFPRSYKYVDPGFYVAAPLPDELIDIIMQFADGRTLVRFSICSPQLRVRADRIASEGLARITTLRLGQPAVADWGTELRLLAVITNPPNLRSLLGPGTAWAPIRDHIEYYASNRFDHPVKMALQLGDAAVIEGVMRTTEPHERSMHVRNFYNRLYTRERYLKNYLSHSPAWCAAHVAGVGTAIPNHFLHVERVQAAAAAGKSIAEHSPLLQSAAEHDRYFPGLHRTNQDSTWGRELSYVR